jgi:mannosyltransferase
MRARLLRPTALALAIIALGYGLRLYHLDAQSFWYDEAYSASVAKGTPSQIILNRFTDVHPPLYYLALHLWQAINDSDFTLRLLSAMAGTAAIGAMYALGKTTFGAPVGILAAAATCLAPYTVFYSQEVRMYSLLLLLSSLLLLSYSRMLSTYSRRWWLAYTACAVCSMYVQYASGLLLLGLHVHFLITRYKDRRAWALLAVCDALVLLAIAPQLAILLGQAQHVTGHQWSAPATPGIARLFSAPYALTLSQFTSESLVPLSFAAILFLFIVTHLQLARQMVDQGDHREHLSLLVCAFWIPVLATFALSQWRSIYRERALIVAVPALYLLFSWGALRTRERYFNLITLLLVGAVAIGALGNWYFDPRFSKAPFHTAARFLNEEVAVSTPILHVSDAALLLFLHYAPEHDHYLVAGDPSPHLPMETYELFGAHILDRDEVTANSFWLVVALDHSIDFQRGLASWFDTRYQLAEARDFDGISVRRYESATPQ